MQQPAPAVAALHGDNRNSGATLQLQLQSAVLVAGCSIKMAQLRRSKPKKAMVAKTFVGSTKTNTWWKQEMGHGSNKKHVHDGTKKHVTLVPAKTRYGESKMRNLFQQNQDGGSKKWVVSGKIRRH